MDKRQTELLTFIHKYRAEILLLLLSWCNFIYMHCVVNPGFLSENTPGFLMTSGYFAFTDILLILTVSSLFCLCRRFLSFCLTYAITLIIALANIVYSRFFDTYFLFDSFSETSNFSGDWWTPYADAAFEVSDLLLVLTSATAVACLIKICSNKHNVIFFRLICILAVSFICYLPLDYYRMIVKAGFELTEWPLFDRKALKNRCLVFDQNRLISEFGILQTQIPFGLSGMFDREQIRPLSPEESFYLDSCLLSHTKRCSQPEICGICNIEFIIVESLISEVIEKKVGNIEVTPNLNSISSRYYLNRNIESTCGAGASSDAQVSYFTGLLPLKNEFSVLYLLKHDFSSLPSILRQNGYNTYMSLPTEKTFWHQDKINEKYAIDVTFSYTEGSLWASDEVLFENIISVHDSLIPPYFHTIITSSMHGPYQKDFLAENDLASPFEFSDDIPVAYCHYLERCWYTDRTIGQYVKYLETSGKLESTIVVIVSDHPVRETLLNVDADDLDNLNLPFIVLADNCRLAGLNKDNAYQTDIFPTILDLARIETPYRGIGKSLFEEGNHFISEDDAKVSNLMILYGSILLSLNE